MKKTHKIRKTREQKLMCQRLHEFLSVVEYGNVRFHFKSIGIHDFQLMGDLWCCLVDGKLMPHSTLIQFNYNYEGELSASVLNNYIYFWIEFKRNNYSSREDFVDDIMLALSESIGIAKRKFKKELDKEKEKHPFDSSKCDLPF